MMALLHSDHAFILRRAWHTRPDINELWFWHHPEPLIQYIISMPMPGLLCTKS